MFRSSSELCGEPMSTQMRQEEKFLGGIISKEKSGTPDFSFRLYYGGVSGAVPFMWESRPGTPKDTLSKSGCLPPLPPPPSYHSRQLASSQRRRGCSRFRLLLNLWSKINYQRPSSSISHRIPPSPGSSSSWSSFASTISWSSSSIPTTPSSFKKKRNCESFNHPNPNKTINYANHNGDWRTRVLSFSRQMNGLPTVRMSKKALQAFSSLGSNH